MGLTNVKKKATNITNQLKDRYIKSGLGPITKVKVPNSPCLIVGGGGCLRLGKVRFGLAYFTLSAIGKESSQIQASSSPFIPPSPTFQVQVIGSGGGGGFDPQTPEQK